MKFLIAFACLLAVAAAQYVVPYAHSAVVAPSTYAVAPYAAHGTFLYRHRREADPKADPIYPVAYHGAYHAAPYAHTAYTYPHAAAAVYYRKRRSPIYPYAHGVAAVHAPVVHGAYSYPYASHAAVYYRKRRSAEASPIYPGTHHGVAAVHAAPYSHFGYGYPYVSGHYY